MGVNALKRRYNSTNGHAKGLIEDLDREIDYLTRQREETQQHDKTPRELSLEALKSGPIKDAASWLQDAYGLLGNGGNIAEAQKLIEQVEQILPQSISQYDPKMVVLLDDTVKLDPQPRASQPTATVKLDTTNGQAAQPQTKTTAAWRDVSSLDEIDAVLSGYTPEQLKEALDLALRCVERIDSARGWVNSRSGTGFRRPKPDQTATTN